MSDELSLIISSFQTIATTKEHQWLNEQSYFNLKKLVETVSHELCVSVSPEEILNGVVPTSKDPFEGETLRKFLTCTIKIICQFRPDSPRCQSCVFKPLTSIGRTRSKVSPQQST